MKNINSLEFQAGRKEEKLPYDNPDFPYLASRADLNSYSEPFIPWHWHNAIELFYMESGELEYCTPHQRLLFAAGSAGIVNANVLHKTQVKRRHEKNIQLLHIFNPILLAGYHGSLIERKYVLPITSSTQFDIIAFSPEDPKHEFIIDLIYSSFLLKEDEFGYEIKIRENLSRIWMESFYMWKASGCSKAKNAETTDKLKDMMIFIHEHYSEKIYIRELASAVFLSERECYRVFQNHLHMTPVDYIRSYRIQIACQMLAESNVSITEVGFSCGMESISYFGKVFRENTGYTPREYRMICQNKNKNCHNQDM
ncbi:MAG TPA: AraC family transcriptional regulator [Candidatus Ornithospirochaeta avicola]|uniref:AraC family transcriptional regulator n=1 Tax=Candidatus Ornithospirochaeta avicola TaxID=2840896 RepID=A0A9D1TNS2_9SPIO|nr:AraC family transcriptional regulator [Candidatus Ornithospirochaeta avicola]